MGRAKIWNSVVRSAASGLAGFGVWRLGGLGVWGFRGLGLLREQTKGHDNRAPHMNDAADARN